MQDLKQACVTLWISHQKYHCAIDTPMNERIDPIEMSSGKCKPAGKTPKENRCMKCAKTLAAARAMSSDVITFNSNKGSWKCRHCDDKENKKEEEWRKSGGKERNKCPAIRGHRANNQV